MAKEKTIEEINKKISAGTAIVLDAEEMIKLVEEIGAEKAAEQVDVVSTATFGPMCSSGLMINTGHSKPRIKMQKVWLNGIPAYGGLAAVDFFLGATELPDGYSANNPFPSRFEYGGGHVIEEFVQGKDIHLRATSYGTDCYPNKEIDSWINVNELNDAYLLNPRNCYQNYNVAVNSSKRTIYTYMGKLLPEQANAHFSTTGELSPLFKDPLLETIGVGTKVLVAGNEGFVYRQGTQHCTKVERKNDVPVCGAATLGITAPIKGMIPDFIRGVSLTGYGTSLSLGIAIPIPVLNASIAKKCAIKNSDLVAPVIDYSFDYGNCTGKVLGRVSYEELFNGEISVGGKAIRASSMSSYKKALELAQLLKNKIKKSEFLLSNAVQRLPLDSEFKPLNIRNKQAGK